MLTFSTILGSKAQNHHYFPLPLKQQTIRIQRDWSLPMVKTLSERNQKLIKPKI